MDCSGITAADLQDNLIAPIIIDEYREQVTKRMEDGGYMNNLGGYHSSVFQEIDWIEEDLMLVLDKLNSKLITYELEPRDYKFKDLSKLF